MYLPGYGPSTLSMVAARTAATRASFLPQETLRAARVLDVGCGPGSITAGLAAQMTISGRLVALDTAHDHLGIARDALQSLVDDAPPWIVGNGSVYALPLATGSIDLAFAHALFEHLANPLAALIELHRVLRPGGTLALISSDWSGARIEPDSRPARQAVEGYRLIRRRAGADPDAGARLAGWASSAGFIVRHEQDVHRQDMTGLDIARYIAERLAAPPAGAISSKETCKILDDARAGARRWTNELAPAAVFQHWVEVLAVAEPARTKLGRDPGPPT